jgi:hypothetical protein
VCLHPLGAAIDSVEAIVHLFEAALHFLAQIREVTDEGRGEAFQSGFQSAFSSALVTG